MNSEQVPDSVREYLRQMVALVQQHLRENKATGLLPAGCSVERLSDQQSDFEALLIVLPPGAPDVLVERLDGLEAIACVSLFDAFEVEEATGRHWNDAR